MMAWPQPSAQNPRSVRRERETPASLDGARTAARRAFSLAFSITQRDALPSAEPHADANPVRCGWPEGRRRATNPSML